MLSNTSMHVLLHDSACEQQQYFTEKCTFCLLDQTYPLRTMTHLHNRFCSDFTLHLHECEKRTGLWWAYWALRTLRVTHFLSFNSSHSHKTHRMWRLIRYVLLFSELNRQSSWSDPVRVMWRCPWGLKIMFDCLGWNWNLRVTYRWEDITELTE